MFPLAWVMNGVAMALVYFLLMNELVTRCGIGKLKHMAINGGYLALDCSTSSTVNISLDVDSTCLFGSYPLKNIIYLSL